MKITAQTLEMVNDIKKNVKAENLHIEVNQNVDTGKEYLIIWCDD